MIQSKKHENKKIFHKRTMEDFVIKTIVSYRLLDVNF